MDAFAAIRRARSLRARHPDAPAFVAQVALAMATYADGKTGAMIRPGFDRLVEDTGLSERSVQRAVKWLEEHGELRRDREGKRGSAACFTYLGVSESPHDANGVSVSPVVVTHRGGHQPNHTRSRATRARTSSLPACSACGGRTRQDEKFPDLVRCTRCSHRDPTAAVQ